MTAKRRWTPENDAELMDVVNVFLGDGNLIKDAFGYYADCYDRTYEAVRRRYFDIKGEDAPDLRLKEKGVNPKPVKVEYIKNIEPVGELHPQLQSISDHIAWLEKQNEDLRARLYAAEEEKELFLERIKQLESCESELKQLVSIIDRSRKEAFAPDTAKKYKIIDGVPAFEE